MKSANRCRFHLFFSQSFESTTFARYPFDWRNPLGYLYAVAFQYIACVYVFTFLSCAIFFGIGAFLLAVSIIKVVRNDLKLFNENALADENRLLILKRLIDFIENHSAVKKLSVSSQNFHALFNKIYNKNNNIFHFIFQNGQ